MPIWAPVPAMPAATERTVPSPPAATTSRAPAARARRACMVPGSDTLVSSQTGPAYPASCSSRSSRPRTAALARGLEGLMTTQASGCPVRVVARVPPSESEPVIGAG